MDWLISLQATSVRDTIYNSSVAMLMSQSSCQTQHTTLCHRESSYTHVVNRLETGLRVAVQSSRCFDSIGCLNEAREFSCCIKPTER